MPRGPSVSLVTKPEFIFEHGRDRVFLAEGDFQILPSFHPIEQRQQSEEGRRWIIPPRKLHHPSDHVVAGVRFGQARFQPLAYELKGHEVGPRPLRMTDCEAHHFGFESAMDLQDRQDARDVQRERTRQKRAQSFCVRGSRESRCRVFGEEREDHDVEL